MFLKMIPVIRIIRMIIEFAKRASTDDGQNVVVRKPKVNEKLELRRDTITNVLNIVS